MSVGHYENFPVASLLLPAPLRHPVEVIYRFARAADDVADEGDAPPAERLAGLAGFNRRLDAIEAGAPRPGDEALAAVIGSHELPVQLFRDLLDAFSQDVVKKRYESFAELMDYCRRSANPVGRLLLHLFRRARPAELAQSDAICSALQLINFWQDVAIDFAKDRVYLPRDDMARFGVTEAHLAGRRCDEAFRALLAFQVSRSAELMRSGAPLGRSLPGRVGLEIRTTVAGGLRILEKIRAADYDVFRRRPVLKAFDWPLLLLRAA